MTKRRKNDFYPTAQFLTEELVCRLNLADTTILEPCAGQLDIANVLKIGYTPSGNQIITNDIDPQMPSEYKLDATKKASWHRFPLADCEWVITNPPFKHAQAILENALQFSPNVAFLLRLSFLEPTYDRSPLLVKRPPDYIIVCPRTSFTGDGNTDSVTCAWMIWSKYRFEMPRISVIPKERAK